MRLRTICLVVVLACGVAGCSSATTELPAAGPGIQTAYPGACSPWVQVNAPAFGLPGDLAKGAPSATLPFQSEEGFEVLVFKEQLYLGMEADNQLGARLWRSRPGVRLPWNQADWEEVSTAPGENPFGLADVAEADHIDSLAGFNGDLYVSTASRGDPPAGARVFRSPSGEPGSWEDALVTLGPGFGDPANENFKDMQVFDGWLCGGTWNAATGAQVWCTADGRDWVLKNRPGFTGAAGGPKNITIWSGHVYNGALYFGVQNQGGRREDPSDDRARLYRAPSLQGEPSWELVFEGGPGSIWAGLLGDLAGRLYLSVAGRQGIQVWTSPSGGPGDWTVASRPGLDGNPRNSGVVVDGAVVYNGALYLGVINAVEGAGVWRTTGASLLTGDQGAWEQVGEQGLGDPGNLGLELAAFNGHLYAWASNYARGQGVLRTACPICQQARVDGPGRYEFPAVGASLDVRTANLESVEICHYPQSPLPDLEGVNLADGYYTVSPNPASAVPGAGLTLTSNIEAGDRSGAARLIHWTGQRWAACPPTPAIEESVNEARCPSVDTFSSPWGIVYGEAPASPAALPASSPLSGLLGLLMIGLLALSGRRGRDY